jgi:SAM-dependent methyltransferase
MRKIDFDHSRNIHTQEGPRAALPVILEIIRAKSILDVGCGVGIWLKTAQECGVTDVFGVDGVDVAPERLQISASLFRQQDFACPWSLGRRFEAVFCLEVAEHLTQKSAGVLIDALVAHSDNVIFGAAIPGQPGQNHINCQWPDYWQKLFNERGYACSDELRWRIWDDERIEPWYRQNIFVARHDPEQAGKEPRIPAAVHPGIYQLMVEAQFSDNMQFVAQGRMPWSWYLKCPILGLARKFWVKPEQNS